MTDEPVIIEGSAVRLSDEEAVAQVAVPDFGGWLGDCPFFLIIEPEHPTPEGNIGIDLDLQEWAKQYADFMRIPGVWWLYFKETMTPVMVLVVHEGEQPYFTKHHVGNVTTFAEITTYGLGKKLQDGSVQRTWLLPNGCVCGGDDVDEIGARIVNRM